jgi:RNA polymerase sigma-70 factor, ECF subfamily
VGRTAVDNQGWEALIAEQVRLHGRLLFRLAFKVLRHNAKAEDVCQQVLLKALQMQQHIRDPQALRGWLARAAVNESLTMLRREGCDRRARGMKALKPPTSPEAGDAAASRAAVDAALQDLPELTQAVVVLRLMQGMSGNEVKDLLGMSASDVSRRLHAGMDVLRERLKAEYAVE